MKDIKFRAWNREVHEWVDLNASSRLVDDDDPAVFKIPADDGVVVFCQYTGLQDRNGKAIYEGDVVKSTDQDDQMYWRDLQGQEHPGMDCGIAQVEFYEGMWYLAEGVNNALYAIKETNNLEVIGNVYEDPELLAQAS